MLLEAVLDVGSDLELGSTLQQIVDTATALTGARQGALGVLEPDRDRVDALYTTGMTEAERQRIDLFPDVPAGNPALAASAPGAPGPDRARAPDAAPDRAPAPAPVRDHTPPPAPAPAPDRSPGPPAEGGSLRTPIVVHTEVFGRLHLSGKPSGPFTDIDLALVRALAAQAGIAIGNARLYGAARQRERWIAGAAAVTTALLTGTDAADALMTVAERARMLADASAGVILQPTEEGGMEIVTASTLDDPAGIVGTVIEPGSAVLVQLLGGEPVFIDDSATDPRMTTGVRSRFGPSMMLPLQSGGRLIGTLALPRRRGDRPYTDLDRLLATQFASQAALALVLADAQADREQLAVYEDRDRIARDLHDLVVQRLFATEMMLESTRRRAAAGANGGRGGGEPPAETTGTQGTERAEGSGTGPGAGTAPGGAGGGDRPGADAGDLLARAVDELDSTIQEVRTAIFALQQPPAEAPATFRGRVLRETGGAAAVLGFPPSVRFTGAVDALVGEEAARELLAALRGALAAAHRRPGVSAIEVEVDATVRLPDGRAGVRLVVADDGRGEDGRPTTMTWEAPL
ncbi:MULTISPECIES: GAF domain-containing protein [Streptomyces]|uniref:GAF domain-containing protein n=1 Tax=Streptomyces TaxID=1883 RepID=UPI0004C00701|nr:MULTISPECIES: GAF domain-containing protein [Streptomyces]QRV59181.1 GAF domain-containing protein [Streptomyces californicus]